jgi:serine/threonine protein kinase
MLDVEHSNIIRLYEVYESRGSVYLVLEMLRGGELMEKISKMGSYDEQDAKMILGNILKALRYLHNKKIMHRDLKPENILLKYEDDKANDIKIVDFGLATRWDIDEYIYSRCGTPGFVAPEVFTATGRYEPVCDVFSAGCIFFLLYATRWGDSCSHM